MSDEGADRERIFRDQITADFKAGKLGIENGWLFEYTEPCKSPGPYGCPPDCNMAPIADLWIDPEVERIESLQAELAEARAVIERAANWLVSGQELEDRIGSALFELNNSAPSSALDAAKADAWDEGRIAADTEAAPVNPYRRES